MRALVMIAAGLSLASAGWAEPPKAPVQKAEQPAKEEPAVVVASAGQRTRPNAEQQQQDEAPAKPARHARATSCRCGDQNPSD